MMRGKVVLVPFPFDDLQGDQGTTRSLPDRSRRSASPRYHGFYQQPNTSRSTGNRPDTKFGAGRLRHDRVTSDVYASVLHRLMTVTTALVRRELGELSPRMQDEVANRLRRLFGLA